MKSTPYSKRSETCSRLHRNKEDESVEKELKYADSSDEEVIKETEKRLREMKQLLIEIRDLLKSAGNAQ